jgi:hypothetical protein
MPGTLTTANSSISLSFEALYPTAQRIVGYSADDVYDTEAVENGEYSMGIDGVLSAGFVFNEIPLTLIVQADSVSLPIFEGVWDYEQSNRTKLKAQLLITLPSLGRRYEFKNGFMRNYKAPASKKILQPAAAAFVFARMQISNT